MVDLSTVSAEDLAAELLKRDDFVCSIWNTEDTISFVTEDEDCEDLDETQKAEAAALLLSHAVDGLTDILGQRGNAYLSDAWSMHKDAILADVSPPTP